MGKGLPYSNSRGNPTSVPTVRRFHYPVNAVTLATATVTTGNGSGTVVIGDFPEGNILFLGGISYLQFSTADADVAATWDGSYAIGTTADANVDNTSPTTDANLIAQATIAAATAKLSPVTRGASAADASEVFDNTDGSLEVNLNLIVDTADYADGATANFTVNGYVELVYIVLGDD